MKMNGEIWIRLSSVGCHTGGQTIIEIRKDYFIHVSNGYVFDKEKTFSHWERLEDKDIKELKNKIKRVDFLSLKDEYIDPNVMDGGGFDFEIYDTPITKKVREYNYHNRDDHYFNQLDNLTDLIFNYSNKYKR